MQILVHEFAKHAVHFYFSRRMLKQTNKNIMRPAKIKIILDICQVQSESSLCTQGELRTQCVFMWTRKALIRLCACTSGSESSLETWDIVLVYSRVGPFCIFSFRKKNKINNNNNKNNNKKIRTRRLIRIYTVFRYVTLQILFYSNKTSNKKFHVWSNIKLPLLFCIVKRNHLTK